MSDSTGNSRTRQTRDDPRSELLSRAYHDAVENAAVEPSPSVDDAIRAAAHRAVEGPPRYTKAARLRVAFRRWRTPLALAATLLLAVGIAFRVYTTGEMEMASPPAATNGDSYRQETGAKEAASKPQPRIEEKPQADVVGGAPPSRDAARSTGDRLPPDQEIAGTAASGRNKVAPSTEPAERDFRGESGTAPAPQSQTAEQLEARPTPTPFPGAPGALPAPPPAREGSAAPRAIVPSQDAAPPAPSVSRPALRGRTERTEEEKAFGVTPTAVQVLAKRLDGRPPEVWIEEIRTLKREGRSGEATELLAALRKKFPDYPLPDDLK
jgi:hypothetical protein